MFNNRDEDIPEEYYQLAEEYEKLYPEITDADIEREIEALQWQEEDPDNFERYMEALADEMSDYDI